MTAETRVEDSLGAIVSRCRLFHESAARLELLAEVHDYVRFSCLCDWYSLWLAKDIDDTRRLEGFMVAGVVLGRYALYFQTNQWRLGKRNSDTRPTV